MPLEEQMAIKKLNKNKTRTLKYKNLLIRYCFDYRKVFTTMKKEEFLNFLFKTRILAIDFSRSSKRSTDDILISLSLIRNEYNDYDLYQYFKINHKLNSHLKERGYNHTIFKLVDFLSKDLSKKDMPDYINVEGSHYVYSDDSRFEFESYITNLYRDFFINGFDNEDIKIKYGLNTDYFFKELEGIYQRELLPIDISQKSYLG